MPDRPDPPRERVERLRELLGFPECVEEDAWTGVRWRVRGATVAHVFGGEDQLVRVTFRAEPEEVRAFEHLGPPYFRAGWGSNVVGVLLDDHTDWDELAELLTDSYCIQAPRRLADAVTERLLPHVASDPPLKGFFGAPPKKAVGIEEMDRAIADSAAESDS